MKTDKQTVLKSVHNNKHERNHALLRFIESGLHAARYSVWHVEVQYTVRRNNGISPLYFTVANFVGTFCSQSPDSCFFKDGGGIDGLTSLSLAKGFLYQNRE